MVDLHTVFCFCSIAFVLLGIGFQVFNDPLGPIRTNTYTEADKSACKNNV